MPRATPAVARSLDSPGADRAMASRPRQRSSPGSDRDRAGRRPRTGSTAARRTSKVVSAGAASPPGGSSQSAPAASSPTSSSASFTGRAAILLLVVAVLAVSYASSARAWLQQRSDISALRGTIAERKAEIASLQQSRQRWQDPAYIEAQARLRFGWVMPGQIGYRVVDAHGHALPDGGSSLSRLPGSTPTTAPAWWQGAWGSVVQAGKTPPAHSATPSRKPALHIGGQAPATEQGVPGGGAGHIGTPGR
jgi:cell division protein FtsB